MRCCCCCCSGRGEALASCVPDNAAGGSRVSGAAVRRGRRGCGIWSEGDDGGRAAERNGRPDSVKVVK